jgi:glycosyltransferase involved in cell wall biosynthesis
VALTLTVLNVAFPLAPVREDTAGGAEQVLRLVDAGLVVRGHRSLVLAAEGSRIQGRLYTAPRPAGRLDRDAWCRAHESYRATLGPLLEQERPHLVHLHGVDFHSYLPADGVPALATLHLPPSFYPAHAFHPGRPRTHLVCVSETQRRACPESEAILGVVPNGVPVDDYAPGPPRRDVVVSLGRICPEKGFHLALAAAKRAGIECWLAGSLYPFEEHVRYFEREVRPRLDGGSRWVGSLDLAGKRRLLARARCLLAPSLVEETSSLVAMEALACGTPVVAFPAGALAEIVEHGRTGFLVSSVEEMADAIAATEELRAEDCRQAALERFSAEAMVDRYVELYRKLVP